MFAVLCWGVALICLILALFNVPVDIDLAILGLCFFVLGFIIDRLVGGGRRVSL